MTQAKVGILMGSKSDLQLMKPAAETLEELGVPFEMRVLSAHRTPARTMEFTEKARERGFRVLICAAGGAAHLAGVVAAHTTLPVIGVPLARTPLAGNDALLATVQMPPGIPVATVGVDGAKNAAFLAVSILALGDDALRGRLEERRKAMVERVIADDESLQSERA